MLPPASQQTQLESSPVLACLLGELASCATATADFDSMGLSRGHTRVNVLWLPLVGTSANSWEGNRTPGSCSPAVPPLAAKQLFWLCQAQRTFPAC